MGGRREGLRYWSGQRGSTAAVFFYQLTEGETGANLHEYTHNTREGASHKQRLINPTTFWMEDPK